MWTDIRKYIATQLQTYVARTISRLVGLMLIYECPRIEDINISFPLAYSASCPYPRASQARCQAEAWRHGTGIDFHACMEAEMMSHLAAFIVQRMQFAELCNAGRVSAQTLDTTRPMDRMPLAA